MSKNLFITFKECRNFLPQAKTRECLLPADVVVSGSSSGGLRLAPGWFEAGLQCEAVERSLVWMNATVHCMFTPSGDPKAVSLIDPLLSKAVLPYRQLFENVFSV